MADEFKNRKDIEILYDLIYNRTTDSPVTQKSEFDEFRETVISDYATKVELENLSNSTRESLQAYANTNDSAVSDIQDDISTIQGDVSTLQTNVTNLQNDTYGNWIQLANFYDNVIVEHRGNVVRVLFQYASPITVYANSYVDVGTMDGIVSSQYFPARNINLNSFDKILSVYYDGLIRIWNPNSWDITTQPFEMIQYTV